MGIGKLLSELLNKINIRPAEFADKIGVPRSTISSIINRDNNKIDIEILFKICDELSISTDEFLGYKKIDRILINKEEEKIIAAYRLCYCKEVIQRALGIIPEAQGYNADIDSEIANEFIASRNFTRTLAEKNINIK